MSVLWRIILREIVRAWRGGGLWPPIAFFLMVAILFPFAIGPDGRLLARIGAGMAWVAALLAALLPVERLVEPDRADGTLDQFAVRQIAEEIVAMGKITGHWLGFAPPLLIALFPAAALFHLQGDALARLILAIAIGSPALAALGVLVAALTAGLRGAGGIAGLVALPLAIPVLIFGAGAASEGGGGTFKLLAASSILLFCLCPFAAAAALRASRT